MGGELKSRHTVTTVTQCASTEKRSSGTTQWTQQLHCLVSYSGLVHHTGGKGDGPVAIFQRELRSESRIASAGLYLASSSDRVRQPRSSGQ